MRSPKMFYVWNGLGDFPLMHGENVMVSAGSAWNNPPKGEGFNAFVIPSEELFVDSGGFQAAKWQKYPYTAEEYMDWAESVGADYVAGMDFACERDLGDLSVEDRLDRTINKQVEQTEVYESNGYDFDLVPVIQGTKVNQYLKSIERLRDYGLLRDYLGVGSICMKESVDEIRTIIDAVCGELSESKDLHLFGAKITVLRERRLWGLFDKYIRSMDTAAWKFLPSTARPEGGMYVRSKEEKVFAFNQYVEKVERYQKAISNQEMLFDGSPLYAQSGVVVDEDG